MAKKWWLSLLLGILFVLLGILVIRMPEESYLELRILFSTLIFISGLAEIVFAINNWKILIGWGWYLAGGVFVFLIGTVLVLSPTLTMTVFPYFLGFWLLFREVLSIGTSIDLKSFGIKGWRLVLATGILTLLLSFLILIVPVIGMFSIFFITALAMIGLGSFNIWLDIALKRVRKNIKNLENHRT